MKLGKKALEALQAEIDGQLKPGDELIVAGPVAAEGTAWIAENYHDRLREVFSERFLEDAGKLPEVYGTGMKKENNKVWKMAEASLSFLRSQVEPLSRCRMTLPRLAATCFMKRFLSKYSMRSIINTSVFGKVCKTSAKALWVGVRAASRPWSCGTVRKTLGSKASLWVVSAPFQCYTELISSDEIIPRNRHR
jgi:hypothetical protein